MPKKLRLESFKHSFLAAARRHALMVVHQKDHHWDDWMNSLQFSYRGEDVEIMWSVPQSGQMVASLRRPRFYLRGDSSKSVAHQLDSGLLIGEDPVKLENREYFDRLVAQAAQVAGYATSEVSSSLGHSRMRREQDFHDHWAHCEDVSHIDVIAAHRVCTAPEMRYITAQLGDVKGKRLLDLGCGLGEASVYFALQGADVTAADLSPGMLDAATRLAQANDVAIRTHLSSAEDLRLPAQAQFDIIYAGNLLHHVDIEATLQRLKPYLAPGGVFVSWDPLAYNPAINVYRAVATQVRTPDEHPLKWADICLFKRHFSHVQPRYFWLTTLIIFVIMAIVQRRNPNRERYWKAVVQEGDRWAWLYRPLERLDGVLLAVLPPLRLLCWNVVIVAKK